MIANNPRYDNSRFVRFSHIQELSLVWNFSSTETSASFKACDIDSRWLPAVGHNPLVEATFNEYERKMLTKVTWKMTNFRIFLATQLYQPAISQASPQMNAPAQQTFDIAQKYGWKFWRYNQDFQGQTILANTKEERATPFIIYGPKSKIFGQMHLGKARQMNWYVGTYSDLTTNYDNLVEYLQNFMQTGMRGDLHAIVPPAVPGAAAYPTLDIQIIPDDPYPANVVTNIQLVNCKMSVEFDLHVYTTFLLSKMQQS